MYKAHGDKYGTGRVCSKAFCRRIKCRSAVIGQAHAGSAVRSRSNDDENHRAFFKVEIVSKGTCCVIACLCCREAQIAEASGVGISAAQLQAELSEVERDITLRKLLWESSDEWIKLFLQWTVSCYQAI